MWSWSPMSFFKSSGEVLKKMARFAQEEWLRVQLGLLAGGQLSEHGRFCGLQHTTQPAQDGEGEDHLTIIGLLVVPAQEIGHGPDEGGKIGVAHDCGLKGVSRRANPLVVIGIGTPG